MNSSETIEPPIRFPEFKEPWETRPIAHILKRCSTAVELEPETQYTQIGLRSHGKGIFYKKPVTGKSLGNKRVFWIQPGCLALNIVFAWEQAVGKTTERERGLIASHRFPMYAPKEKQADIDFMVRFFLRPRGKHLLGLASPGGAGRNRTLGQKEFDKLKVVVPSLPEQRKIADFLTAVDGRIGQLIQKKALLEDYKKGVMQQLFTQAIRFKDEHGNDFPDWEEKKLGQLGDIITGGTPQTSDCELYGNDYMFVSPADISNARFVTTTKKNLSSQGYEKGRRVQERSSLFVCIGSTIGKVAQAAKDCTTNQQVNSIVPNRGNSADFVYSLLEYHSPRIKELAATQAVPIINKTTFAGYSLTVPHPDEQTKIADFLSALDRKIESVATQITETQTFKRGLLQQMFVLFIQR